MTKAMGRSENKSLIKFLSYENEVRNTLMTLIVTVLLSFLIIIFLTENLNISCSDTFKKTCVYHRGHGSNTNHLKQHVRKQVLDQALQLLIQNQRNRSFDLFGSKLHS